MPSSSITRPAVAPRPPPRFVGTDSTTEALNWRLGLRRRWLRHRAGHQRHQPEPPGLRAGQRHGRVQLRHLGHQYRQPLRAPERRWKRRHRRYLQYSTTSFNINISLTDGNSPTASPSTPPIPEHRRRTARSHRRMPPRAPSRFDVINVATGADNSTPKPSPPSRVSTSSGTFRAMSPSASGKRRAPAVNAVVNAIFFGNPPTRIHDQRLLRRDRL